MKIVLDTNVLIDGFRDEYSYEKKIIDAVARGEIEAFANKQTLRENKLLLRQVVDNDDYKRELNEFFAQVSDVPNYRQVRIVRDREDNKILESAVEARADYLVTSDNDLLSIERYRGVRIVRPQQFWANYKDEGQDLWNKWASFISGQRRT